MRETLNLYISMVTSISNLQTVFVSTGGAQLSRGGGGGGVKARTEQIKANIST